MQIKPFSQKQQAALAWWCKNSDYKDYDAIICDGSVRAGKTVCLGLSFILWAMSNFDGVNFAICGKTITSCERNVISPITQLLKKMNMTGKYGRTNGYMDIKSGKKSNRFYVFGGKDEGSAALIQGVTLAGVLFDEVALMPRSFVEQALARCSVEGSKFWFNCNPESPSHWFKTEWIDHAEEKRAFRLHFTMDDNPSLSKKVKDRYERIYSGVFYERFVLGLWVIAQGLVYPMFDKDRHIISKIPQERGEYYVSIDYGTVNPTSMGLWKVIKGKAIRIREYYYSGRATKEGQPPARKTDEEYYCELEKLTRDLPIEYIVIDPSAASFIECVRRHGEYYVLQAKNSVSEGIQIVSSLLTADMIQVHSSCADSIKEFSLYRWNEKVVEDKPIKENDHAMDDIRYFCNTILKDEFAWMEWGVVTSDFD